MKVTDSSEVLFPGASLNIAREWTAHEPDIAHISRLWISYTSLKYYFPAGKEMLEVREFEDVSGRELELVLLEHLEDRHGICAKIVALCGVESQPGRQALHLGSLMALPLSNASTEPRQMGSSAWQSAMGTCLSTGR